MAALDNLVVDPLQAVTPDLAWLGLEQRKAPTDIRLAHDIGLAHYWLAKSFTDPNVRAQHWLFVIANWAMVLQREFFWQAWANERSQTYQQTITPDEQEKARTELENRINGELDGFDTQFTHIHPFLKLTYALEHKSIRFLRKMQGFQWTSPLEENLYCGPLLLRQLGMQSAARTFFADQRFDSPREKSASLQFILSSIHGYTAKQELIPDLSFGLRVCYSSLGLAWVCMEKADPRQALELLSQQQCPECQPQFATTEGFSPLEPCREDCARFDKDNPSYSSIPNGRALFVRDAAELGARAHLLQAERYLGSDVPALLSHFRQALKAAQKLEIQESLREQIGELLMLWAGESEQDKQWDDVIMLLKDAAEFDTKGIWLSKLALAYDQRGVERFKAGAQKEGCDDLRQAYALTPYVERIKSSLLNALRECEVDARRGNDDSLSAALSEEIKRIETGGQPVAPSPEGEKNLPPPPPPIRSELPVSNLVHPELFTREGYLNWNQFAPDGELIIRSACQRAIDSRDPLVDLPALILALYKESHSARKELQAQGFSLENQQLFSRMRKQMPEQEEVNPRLHALKPSQFDLWITVVDILVEAWEQARQENNKITEAHILYGMHASLRSREWLESIGLKLGTP